MKGPFSDIYVRQSYFFLIKFLYEVGIKAAGPLHEDIYYEAEWIQDQQNRYEEQERMMSRMIDLNRSGKL